MGQNFIILAGWIIDGTGSRALRNAVLHVENGIVASILDTHVERPPRLQQLPIHEFSGHTLVPALVDSHVHLTLSGTVDPKIRNEQSNYPFEQKTRLMDKRMAKYLSRGILGLRDGGDHAGHSLRYRNVKTSAPVHFAAAGSAWRAEGRYGGFIAIPPPQGMRLAESVERSLSGNNAPDHLKILNSGLNSMLEFGRQTPPQFEAEELKPAIETARRFGLKTMVHANGRIPVRDAISAGCASVEHGYFMGRENLERLAELQIAWVPTIFAMKAYLLNSRPAQPEASITARNLDHQLEQVSLARQLGVRIALGSDSGGFGLSHGDALIEEMKMLIEAGLSGEQAIKAASMEGATLLGINHELGVIKTGMPATFVVVSGNPEAIADSLQNVRAIYFRGEKLRQI